MLELLAHVVVVVVVDDDNDIVAFAVDVAVDVDVAFADTVVADVA